MWRIECPLNLHNIILIKRRHLNNRPWRIPAWILAPYLLLDLIAHWAVLIHVSNVDDKAEARVDVGAHHLDETLHVLVRLPDTRQPSLDEGAGCRIDAAHACVSRRTD
jgi:hypothetical protein